MSSSPAGLDISTEATDQGQLVKVRGELDLATAPALADAIGPGASPGGAQIVLDLSQVTFIDSSALRTLVVAGRQLSEAGGHLAIGPRSDIVARVLEVTQLDQQTEAFQVLPESV